MTIRLKWHGTVLLAALALAPKWVTGTEVLSSVSLAALAEQNRLLQDQITRQQRQLDDLAAQLATLRHSGEATRGQLDDLRTKSAEPDPTAAANEPASPIPTLGTNREHEVRISGEAGLAFFATGPAGQFPESTFRIDDAKIFFEAAVMQDVYFVGGLDLFIRENNNDNVQLGELYVEMENVSGRLGGPDRLVNVRVGRMNIPFGEEYLTRGPVDNPLISHSLSDVWGLDTGVELYGSGGRASYVLAVQNGGLNLAEDHDSDKSVTARLGWKPLPWLGLSASAMRTGGLSTGPYASPSDRLSAVWFGNGFFRALGPSATTTNFHANLWQGDAVARWTGGHVGAALGGVDFDDNDTAADNSRRLAYGYVEGAQTIAGGLYGAARFSRIEAPDGYPLVGWGDFGRYFFAPPLTEELNRLSLGLGYRFGPPLVLKFEYSFEWGEQTNGDDRDQENFLGGELGLKF